MTWGTSTVMYADRFRAKLAEWNIQNIIPTPDSDLAIIQHC